MTPPTKPATVTDKETTMPTYSISAGQYDSMLDTRHDRTGHATIAAAKAALARVTPYNAADLVTVPSSDGGTTFVYASQEEADADTTGMAELASIERIEE